MEAIWGALAAAAMVGPLSWWVGWRLGVRTGLVEAAETLRSVHRIHGLFSPLPSASCGELYRRLYERAEID